MKKQRNELSIIIYYNSWKNLTHNSVLIKCIMLIFLLLKISTLRYTHNKLNQNCPPTPTPRKAGGVCLFRFLYKLSSPAQQITTNDMNTQLQHITESTWQLKKK